MARNDRKKWKKFGTWEKGNRWTIYCMVKTRRKGVDEIDTLLCYQNRFSDIVLSDAFGFWKLGGFALVSPNALPGEGLDKSK